MTIFVFFDAYASAYEIQGEVGGLFGTASGVTMTLLQRQAGDCPTSFCMKIEVDDAKAQAVLQQATDLVARYPGSVSNVRIMMYKAV